MSSSQIQMGLPPDSEVAAIWKDHDDEQIIRVAEMAGDDSGMIAQYFAEEQWKILDAESLWNRIVNGGPEVKYLTLSPRLASAGDIIDQHAKRNRNIGLAIAAVSALIMIAGIAAAYFG